jgi:hypothetical protein
MTEDPERQIRRRTLERERNKLTQAQEWLAAVHKTRDEDEDMGGSSEATMDEPMEDWKGSFA